MKYLLDTNVISELIAPKPNPKVIQWIDQLDPNMVYLSVITIGEIRKGVEKLASSKKREAIAEWLENDLLVRFQGRILEITVQTMLTWGELTGRLAKQGKPMNAIDSLIAAIALQGNYVLVTRNVDDFQNPDVNVFNPWA
ncbi:MAG: type II toxin-antitoxin system VapC family toxin [Chloroflexota bacterium]|nr:MAG: type II toxin-antitoxin system VapC family toxin [Chloroflexota bacterium]